ncbi:MAG: hypothetical protein ACI33P_05530 [Lysinibacillus sp.]
MKGRRVLYAASIAIVLAGCTAEGEVKEDIAINTGLILKHTVTKPESEAQAVHSGYIGDSFWETDRQLLVRYQDAPVSMEYSNEFYVETIGDEIIYRMTNNGDGQFDWKIMTPAGNLWNSGTLTPGQSKTFIAKYDDTHMPKGLYTFSVIPSGEGDALFDFVVAAPQ